MRTTSATVQVTVTRKRGEQVASEGDLVLHSNW